MTTNITFSYALPLLLTILAIAGKWGIFEKMGEEGWKVLIPFYGEYTLYKRVWNTKMYWLTLVLSTLSLPVLFVSGWMLYGHVASSVILVAGAGLAFASMVFVAITQLMLLYKLAKAFGQGKAFTFGLVMISSVFYMLLGFGEYEYARA